MSQPPKIVHFYQDNHNFGGIQVYLKNTLGHLAKRGQFQVVYVGTQNSKLTQVLEAEGIRTRGIPFPFKKGSLLKSLITKPLMRTLDLRVYWHLLKILEEEKPDLVHVHGGRIEQGLIKQLGNYPLVYTYHAYGNLFNLETAQSELHALYYRMMRPLFSALIPYLDGMTVVSNYERERLYREKFIPPDFKPEVIYNGLALEEFNQRLADKDRIEIRKALGIPENARVITFACRLANNKNAMAFLRLARRIAESPERTQSVFFLIAGEGRLAPQFEAAFKLEPQLSKMGRYLGFRNDVPELLLASDFTVSTSLQEGFGLRVLESMVVGAPCITYAAGGIPEVMNFPESGPWLVPVGDEEALYQATMRAIHLSDKELAELAPKLKQQAACFDIARQTDALEQFYHRMLAAQSDLETPSSTAPKVPAGAR